MNISMSERPGVYSGYSASSIVTASSANAAIGLVAVADGITEPTAYVTTAAARTAFGASSAVYACIEAALAGGASACWVSPVSVTTDASSTEATAEAYAAAAKALRDRDVYILITDSSDLAVHQLLRDEAVAASAERRERICVFTLGGDVTALTTHAAGLASERCVLAGPVPPNAAGEPADTAVCAAAVAAAIAELPDPAVPLGGAALAGLYGSGGMLEDAEVDALVQGGVTPIECSGGTVEVVRGVTTRTAASDPDGSNTWRELATILIADDVMTTLRSALKSRFARAKNLPSTREAVSSQVTLELEAKKSAGIIADYGEVRASASETDPSRCDVSFEFAVAHGLERIVVAAHILV